MFKKKKFRNIWNLRASMTTKSNWGAQEILSIKIESAYESIM